MPAPVLYLSHGAPPLADDERWTDELARWSADLPKPRSVLMVSAHWEDAPTTLGSTTGAPLTYDFWGFPQRYYEVTYDAPARLARRRGDHAAHLARHQVHRDEARGLDHGAYVPLKEMFPDADVPVLQMSMPTLDPRACSRSADGARPARAGHDDRRLRLHDPQPALVQPRAGSDALPPAASAEFDHWARRP